MRHPNLRTPTRLNLALPCDVRAHLDDYLRILHRGRIPPGAYQDFFTARLMEFFAKESENVQAKT